MFTKYHKAKLKTKQQGWFIPIKYSILAVIPLIINFTFTTMSKTLKEINIIFEIPNLSKSIVFLWLILFLITAWYLSPISFSKIQRMRYKLKQIIEVNQFYYENKDLNKITLSMLIKFYWLEDNLYLEVYPNGGKYTHKMNELTEIFQTSLNMTVIAVQDDFANHTTYILSKETDNYIDSTDEWTV
ncbi:hypothetical protein [Rummeliibacillus sp. BSL5]